MSLYLLTCFVCFQFCFETSKLTSITCITITMTLLTQSVLQSHPKQFAPHLTPSTWLINCSSTQRIRTSVFTKNYFCCRVWYGLHCFSHCLYRAVWRLISMKLIFTTLVRILLSFICNKTYGTVRPRVATPPQILYVTASDGMLRWT